MALASPLITFDYLNEISGGDTDFQKEIIQTFLEEMANEIDRLQNACDQQDWPTLGSVAHKVKAPINMLCTEPLKTRILHIEKTAKAEQDVDSLPGEVKLLIQDLGEVMAALRTM
jgi:HPt (histidine-containing phosphotransfer) domain-containing protein